MPKKTPTCTSETFPPTQPSYIRVFCAHLRCIHTKSGAASKASRDVLGGVVSDWQPPRDLERGNQSESAVKVVTMCGPSPGPTTWFGLAKK